MTAQPGYLYLLTNPTMPGMVKIGRTSRAPGERLTELSSATGVPTAFELIYDVLVPDAERAEAVLHSQLSAAGYRVADNREFFRVPVREALRLMLHLREFIESPTLARNAPIAGQSPFDDGWVDEIEADSPAGERDPEFRRAAELCIKNNTGSTSLLQRRLGIGYGRAARLIDQLHAAGIIGPPNGGAARDVLVRLSELESRIGSEG